jgi:hypothetical protein
MNRIQDWNWNRWRVLPHRSVLDCSLYAASGVLLRPDYEHVDCGMPLSVNDIEANWCPHCVKTLNRAADKRARAAREG